MKTCVLFDLDGTLLDTLGDLADSVNYALGSFGLPQRTVREIRSFLGNGAANLIRQASGVAENWPEILTCYKTYYDAHCQIKTKPYPGIPEALEVLAEDYALGVVSNKPDKAVQLLSKDYFPTLYALGETPDCPIKPAPDMLYKAMQALGADCCVFVGDSEVDIQTARNAGFPCVSVMWGFRDPELLAAHGATYCCSDAAQLPELIRAAIEGYYGK